MNLLFIMKLAPRGYLTISHAIHKLAPMSPVSTFYWRIKSHRKWQTHMHVSSPKFPRLPTLTRPTAQPFFQLCFGSFSHAAFSHHLGWKRKPLEKPHIEKMHIMAQSLEITVETAQKYATKYLPTNIINYIKTSW